MNWFSFTLLSIFSLAIAELTQQRILHKKNTFDERTSVVITVLIQVPLILALILAKNLQSSLLTIFFDKTYLFIILIGLIGSFGNLFYFKSLNAKNISLSTIFVSSSVIIATVLGILFLGESVTITKFLGIGLVLIAVIVLNLQNLQLEKSNYFGLLAALVFGITYPLEKAISLNLDTPIYMFWGWIAVVLCMFLGNPQKVVGSLQKASLTDYIPVLISACGYFLFNLFTLTAYKLGGEAGTIDALNNSQIFIIIIVEYFIFRQTKGITRKLGSAVIALIGIALLSQT